LFVLIAKKHTKLDHIILKLSNFRGVLSPYKSYTHIYSRKAVHPANDTVNNTYCCKYFTTTFLI